MGAIYPAGVTSLYGETLALSTTLASLGMPGIETKQAILYAPASDFRLHINPLLVAAYIYDNSQTGVAKWIDRSVALQDRASVGTGTAMDDFTTSDRVFLCFSDVTGGFYVDIGAANGTANNMTANYWNGSAWTSLSETDNTDTGASLAASGTVTWTAPTDAVMRPLGGPLARYGTPYAKIDSTLTTNEALDATETGIDCSADPSSLVVAGDYIMVDSEVMYVNASSATGSLLTVTRGVLGSTAATHLTAQAIYLYNINGPSISGFWVELLWNAGMGSDTEIANIWALNKNTTRGYFRAGTEYEMSFDRRNVGAIEAVLASGSDTLQVTWIRNIV